MPTITATTARTATYAAPDDLEPGDSFIADGDLYVCTDTPTINRLVPGIPTDVLIPATRNDLDYSISWPLNLAVIAYRKQ